MYSKLKVYFSLQLFYPAKLGWKEKPDVANSIGFSHKHQLSSFFLVLPKSKIIPDSAKS